MKQMMKRAYCSILLKKTYYQCRTVSYKTSDKFKQHNNAEDNSKNYYVNYGKKAIGIGIAAFIAYTFNENRKHNILLQAKLKIEVDAGNIKDGLPNYSLEEVGKHRIKEDGVWVTYKQGVYDITKFVSEHPGGDQIMMAAGGAADPFWLLYAAHKTPKVMALLESMRIGNLLLEDSKSSLKDMSDPYSEEPSRHAALKPASLKPYNAEPPPHILVDNFITPNDLFYVRNHLPVPLVDIKTYELEIEVEGTTKTKVLTFDEIKKLPRHQITATVMCAGNRRSEMTKVKAVKGLDWGHAATGNAVWTGAKLRDVLQLIGINEDTEGYGHVQFEGLDTDTTSTPYGASIPFSKAVDRNGDVILAYEMNGKPLSRDHGFPIRVIVPGVVGARNVKWLGKIIVSPNESESHWQHRDYKGFSPSVDWDTVDWDKSPAIQELPVISAICKPSEGDTVKLQNGHVIVQGYAWSGGGKQIVRIDVTIDKGETWHVANIDFQDASLSPRHWAWTLWSAKIPVKHGIKEMEIWAKAVDSSYNTQPESFKNIWNLRGVLNNAYHRVKVHFK